MTEGTPRTRTTAPVINYGELEAEDTQDIPTRNVAEVLDGTPFVAWLEASKESGMAKRFTIPAAAVEQTEYLLRRAGKVVDTGVGIRTETLSDGSVRVTAWSKAKRVNKPKEAQADPAPAPGVKRRQRRS